MLENDKKPVNMQSRITLSFLLTLVIVIAGLVTQWTIVAQKTSEVDTIRAMIESHRLDTNHHVDPERDERRWQELIKRLERIEDKLDHAKN